MTTKEKILDSALMLFSQKGYDGVGVDLIAENIGIKGPSIYKHFHGKEEILNILIEQVEEYYEQHFGSEANLGKLPDCAEELYEQSMKRIEFTMKDETIQKIRRILAMEQFRNEKIAKLATKHYMDGIQGMYEKIFEGMMAKGIIQQENAKMLAMSFAAPITLLIQMYDREPEKEQEIMTRMQKYLQYMLEKMYGEK